MNDSHPFIGTVHFYRDQRYVLFEIRDHARADGSSTQLAVWISRCADCGGVFETITPAQSSRFQPNRRCQQHKRPGRRVRSSK